MTALHTAEQIRAVPPDVPLRDADGDLYSLQGGFLSPLAPRPGLPLDKVVARQVIDLAVTARLPLTPLRPEPTEEAWDTLTELLRDGLDEADTDYAVTTVRAWLTEATR